MTAPNDNPLCRQAEAHYYDFLHEGNRKQIEGHIIDHIEHCQNCQVQINWLREVLSQSESGLEEDQKRARTAVNHMLKLHFSNIGKCVTCGVVKPYLPTLLDSALTIKIPTPITAHIDNCQQCLEDLETIQHLNLSPKQLRRLSRIFAEEPPKDVVKCSEIAEMTKSVAAMDFGLTTAEALQHLSKCPSCRDVLYEERQKMRDNLSECEYSSEFPCEAVSATDIFDYVVPYGLDPANDQYAKFRESFISHLRTCPNCLAKMQELHKTIYGISNRTGFEVITVYHIDESAKAKTASETKELYAGFPVRVDVIRPEEVKTKTPAPIIDLGSALKQKVSTRNLKLLVRIGVAAAAVILIAVALFSNIPAAKAITLSQIYKALEKVKNVHISSFVPDKTEPIQEQWVSRTLSIYMSKTGKQSILWDIRNRVRKSKQLDAASVETSPLSTEMITEIEGAIGSFWGLVPFADLSVVPGNAKWNRITDRSLEVTAKDIEVYDLAWSERAYDGSTVFNKWRFFVDPKTNLPKRTESYQKLPADDEYILISAMEVEYLSDSKMQEAIKKVFF
jgi:hypothetical protein